MKRQRTRLINTLMRYDSPATSTAAEFFTRHHMPWLKDRLMDGWLPYFGTTRVLRQVLVSTCDLNAREFVRFHRAIYGKDKIPHLEDAITVVVLTLAAVQTVTGLLSLGLQYSGRRRQQAEKDMERISDQDRSELLSLFKYLAKTYALRELYYSGKISRKEFLELRRVAEVAALDSDHGEASLERVERIWVRFNKAHDLPLDTELLKELEMLAAQDIAKAIPPIQKTKSSRKVSNAPAKGLAASPGEAYGAIRVVASSADVGKVTKGDVCVFHYFNPDMVPAIAKCAASIGLVGCGGRTGHLAIVSRELGIPCVIGIESGSFRDGVKVVVNGNKGEIKRVLEADQDIVVRPRKPPIRTGR